MTTLIEDTSALPDPGSAIDASRDDQVLDLLPEQEWCDSCSTEEVPADDVEAGVPRDVVDVSVESEPGWDAALLGPGPQYEVTHLACGHVLARLC